MPNRVQRERARRRRSAGGETAASTGSALAPPAKPTLLQRVRYSFDLALARGPMVVIAWLGGLTLVIIVADVALFDLVRLAPFDQAIVLGYRGALTAAEADSRTLLTLLTLRKMFGGTAESPIRIVAEVLDRAIARASRQPSAPTTESRTATPAEPAADFATTR